MGLPTGLCIAQTPNEVSEQTLHEANILAKYQLKQPYNSPYWKHLVRLHWQDAKTAFLWLLSCHHDNTPKPEQDSLHGFF